MRPAGQWPPESTFQTRLAPFPCSSSSLPNPSMTWEFPSLTIVQDDQERRQQVTHALHIAHIQVFPHIAARSGTKLLRPLGP